MKQCILWMLACGYFQANAALHIYVDEEIGKSSLCLHPSEATVEYQTL